MNINIKKLHQDAQIPEYATDGSGCFDLRSVESATVINNDFQGFSTGLSFEIPDGFVMLIFSRSGHGFTKGIRLANCVGVIDSDYRGEVKVKLKSDQSELVVNVGDRIAQAMVMPIPRVHFTEVQDLSETERGSGGFGSTGSV